MVLVIDGVVLWDLDYIDLGRIRMPSQTMPVIVKSLVFTDDPRHPADPHYPSEPAIDRLRGLTAGLSFGA